MHGLRRLGCTQITWPFPQPQAQLLSLVPRKPAGQKCPAGLSMASGSEPLCHLPQRSEQLHLFCFSFNILTVGRLHGVNLRAKSPDEQEM